MRRGLTDQQDKTLARVHALAVHAMESVTPAAAVVGAGVLTPDELRLLSWAKPGLVAAITRAFSHIPIDGRSTAVDRRAVGEPVAGRVARAAVAENAAPESS